MAEPKLGRQISDLYVQFTAGSISRRELAKRVGALGVSAAAVQMFMRGVPASAQDATPVASPVGDMGSTPVATYEPFTSMTREEWKKVLFAWWAEQDPAFTEAGNPGGQVIQGEAVAFIATTNALLGADSPTNPFNALVFETLVGSSPIDGQYVPGLADYWTIDSDGKTYTFFINANANWHDGQPVTADDVAFSFAAQADPATSSSYTGTFNAFVASWEVVDAKTIKMVATDIFPSVVFMGNAYAPIMPKHVWESVDHANWASDPGSTGADLSRVVGSGPFKYKEFDGSALRASLEKNADYWDDVATIDEFVLQSSGDETAALEQLRAGDVDFYENVPAASVADLDALDNLNVALYPTYSFSWYGYNLDPEKTTLFQQVEVRHALLYAIDRESLVKNSLLGFGQVANGSQPELSIAFKPDEITTKYVYDVEKAKQLLADAGWADSDGDGIVEKDGQKLSFQVMYGAGSATTDSIVAAIQDYWKAVGVDGQPNPVDFSNVLVPALTDNFNFEICLLGFNWDATGDQSAMFATSSYKAGFNAMKYSNPKVDELMAQSNRELDADKRVAELVEINDLINEDLPVAVLWFRKDRTAYNVRMHNFVPNAPGGLLWTIPYVWVDPS
ncbi:MAG TPA: ABC transporter substrate-binding protein [Thermomicrobiales bacterium]|nr:ABC transporter substrate-binding protein [Thermomicrobiales bacterium]